MVARVRERFWGGKSLGHPGSIYAEARGDLRAIADFFASLKPATEEQRELIGAAKQAFARLVETTLLMARQLANPVPLLLGISKAANDHAHRIGPVSRTRQRQSTPVSPGICWSHRMTWTRSPARMASASCVFWAQSTSNSSLRMRCKLSRTQFVSSTMRTAPDVHRYALPIDRWTGPIALCRREMFSPSFLWSAAAEQ
jgi:hypothetical protein